MWIAAEQLDKEKKRKGGDTVAVGSVAVVIGTSVVPGVWERGEMGDDVCSLAGGQDHPNTTDEPCGDSLHPSLFPARVPSL